MTPSTQPAAFGDTYLQLQLDDPFGCFDAAAAEAAIGEAARERYRRAIAERWRKAKEAVLAAKAEHAAKVVARKGRYVPSYERTTERELNLWTLERLHLQQLERAGDVDGALAVLREDLSPSVERYHLVLKAGAAAGQDVSQLREELLDALETRELAELSPPPVSSPFPVRRRVPEERARDVSLRAEVLCSEQRWAEACALVQPPAACRDGVLRHIALHLDATHAQQALELLLRMFRSAMHQSSSPYRNELELVNEIAGRLDPARRAAWLAQLRIDYKAKRNFVRDLPTA